MLDVKALEQLDQIVYRGNGSLSVDHKKLRYDLTLEVNHGRVTVAVSVCFNGVIAIFISNDPYKNQPSAYIKQYCINCLNFAKDNYRKRLLKSLIDLE